MKEPRGIQSIEVGGQLLLALAHHGRPMALKDLAREAGMSPAKAHPYLVSFIKLGLVEQDGGSGPYGLGPLAMQLGLISLQQYDPVRLATPVVEELAQQLGHTVAIAVWGTHGPTIVRVAEGPTPVHISMRHGTVMSLAGTASGRLFATWRADEAAALGESLPDAVTIAAVREEGLATSRDGVVAGVSAAAAPVFDAEGRLVLALTAIGPSTGFDTSAESALPLTLRHAAAALSRRLGYRPAG
ncbi:IclR family transcriptional regulator [Roseateles asaccharophilus]|uniref:DNA-binding IclR family transcriptional regulator n=1 Tax=Roseateles asaccharophilus TaxID=582607 RepID=A0ABU2AHL7_9BURK|nr:IclR family transcriptional regulator [Roseateles asaccharophilus]MDR7336133.1 DNA-binding IclR family transcriptional regulator [Roseateles asaccharophilus]